MRTKFKTTVNSLAIILFSVMILSSCSSDDSNDDQNGSTSYYIKAKVNGQNISVSHLAQALQQGSGNNKTLTLYASTSLSQIYPFFSCDIEDLTQVTTGTYNHATHIMLFQYYDTNNNTYGDYEINGTFPFQLQITEVTSSTVKGTFQGSLRVAGSNTEIVTISDGEFFLPRYYNEYGNTTPTN
jgi:hypothetical protein